MAFAELSITSNFSFLTGGSHPQEYALRAIELGLPAFAIADRNSVAGLVRAHHELKEAARDGTAVPRLLPAARLVLADGLEITALARSRAGWARLCRLLTLGASRARKGECLLSLDDLTGLDALHLLLHLPAGRRDLRAWLPAARAFAGGHRHAHLVASPRYDGQDAARIARAARVAASLGLPLVASAEPIMHHASRRRLVDVLTCIREGLRIDRIGRAALANAERRLRSEAEMLRLFGPHAAAVHRAGEIAADCGFALDELAYEYPREIWDGEDPQARLARLTDEGLRYRYPGGVPEVRRAQADKELALIARKAYAPFFLTVHDAVVYARSQGILCQGRGSAANSIVCWALGITSMSPEVGTMVFERFVSDARDEPPDIDVDFEHERREEVIQYIYRRFGRERAGICATVIHYRGKRAIREVGAAMGLSRDTVAALSRQIWGWGGGGLPRERLVELGLDPDEPRLAADHGARRRDRRLPAPPLPARRRLRHHRGAARRARPDRERRDGGPHRHLLGQGRHRHPRHPEGRRAGAWACSPASARRSSCSPSTAASATRWRACRPRTRRSTTCSAAPTRSASSRWRAGRSSRSCRE